MNHKNVFYIKKKKYQTITHVKNKIFFETENTGDFLNLCLSWMKMILKQGKAVFGSHKTL